MGTESVAEERLERRTLPQVRVPNKLDYDLIAVFDESMDVRYAAWCELLYCTWEDKIGCWGQTRLSYVM